MRRCIAPKATWGRLRLRTYPGRGGTSCTFSRPTIVGSHRRSSKKLSGTPTGIGSSAETKARLASGVVEPTRELAAGELLQGGDVLAEAAADRLEEVVGEHRLGRRRLLGVVSDLLDKPAHRLRQPVEGAVEGAQPGKFDQPLHELVFVA